MLLPEFSCCLGDAGSIFDRKGNCLALGWGLPEVFCFIRVVDGFVIKFASTTKPWRKRGKENVFSLVNLFFVVDAILGVCSII